MRGGRIGFLAVVVALAAGACGGGAPPGTGVAAGELIAYVADDGIHVVAADGSDDWKIRGTGSLYGPEWAPDGERLAAVDLDDCCKAFAVTLAGDRERLPADSSTTPAWSPDGMRIAAVAEADETRPVRVQIVRVSDGRVERVLSPSGNEPDWSPDGSTIALQGRDPAEELLRIYLVPADGSGPAQRLTDLSGGDAGETEPRWSHDGKSIAFMSDHDGDDEIYTIRRDGTRLNQLTDNDVYDSTPSWSPDGSRIVFARGDGIETGDIVVRHLKTGEETIVATGGLLGAPSWQPRVSRDR